jgi:glycine C-acetyltransferase
MEDLQSKLKEKSTNKFVITEGIFSMDGDFSKIKEITEIAQIKNAIVILDDAHGDFAVGKDGKGTANLLGVSKKIDVYVSSLSKALGSFGGYVSSQKNIIDMNINKSKSFIYTSALPSFLVNYSLERLKLDRNGHQKKLQSNTKMILKGLEQIGYQINSKTHIVPITVGDEKTALNFGKYLYQKGVFAQPIRFPTVPKNKARIRISVTGWLSKKEIEDSLKVFERGYSKFLK